MSSNDMSHAEACQALLCPRAAHPSGPGRGHEARLRHQTRHRATYRWRDMPRSRHLVRSDPAARRKRPHCRDGTGGPGQRTRGAAAVLPIDRTGVERAPNRGSVNWGRWSIRPVRIRGCAKASRDTPLPGPPPPVSVRVQDALRRRTDRALCRGAPRTASCGCAWPPAFLAPHPLRPGHNGNAAAHASNPPDVRLRRPASARPAKEDRNGHAAAGPSLRVPILRSPPRFHRDRRPVAGARYWRQQPHLWSGRRVRAAAVSLSGPGSTGLDRSELSKNLTRDVARGSPFSGRVRRHSQRPLAGPHWRFRSRQSQHFRRRRARTRIHSARAGRPVPGPRDEPDRRPRFHQGGARPEGTASGDPESSSVADPVRSRPQHRESRDPHWW